MREGVVYHGSSKWWNNKKIRTSKYYDNLFIYKARGTYLGKLWSVVMLCQDEKKL